MKQVWNTEELSEHWSLSYEELDFLKKKPYKNHIAVSVQLKYYKYFGCFPQKPEKVAEPVLLYITEQLSITIETYYSYNWNDRLSRYHRQEILDFLGIRKITESDKKEIQDWLCQTIFPQEFSASEALEHVYEWLQDNKIDRPAEKEIIRDLNSAYSQFEKSL